MRLSIKLKYVLCGTLFSGGIACVVCAVLIPVSVPITVPVGCALLGSAGGMLQSSLGQSTQRQGNTNSTQTTNGDSSDNEDIDSHYFGSVNTTPLLFTPSSVSASTASNISRPLTPRSYLEGPDGLVEWPRVPPNSPRNIIV